MLIDILIDMLIEMPIDTDWCRFICWLVIKAFWCWLMLIDAECWLILIPAQIRCKQVFICRSVPPELLQSFSLLKSSRNFRKTTFRSVYYFQVDLHSVQRWDKDEWTPHLNSTCRLVKRQRIYSVKAKLTQSYQQEGFHNFIICQHNLIHSKLALWIKFSPSWHCGCYQGFPRRGLRVWQGQGYWRSALSKVLQARVQGCSRSAGRASSLLLSPPGRTKIISSQ